MQLEFKGKDPFTYRITAKLFFAVNTLPIADDKTFAYMRRVILIPFLARFIDELDKAQKREKKLIFTSKRSYCVSYLEYSTGL